MDRGSFFVPGVPKSKGSKRALPVGKKGGQKRTIMVETVKGLGAWMNQVSSAFRREYPDHRPTLTGAVFLSMTFYFARPKCHYRTGRFADQLKPSASKNQHTKLPDALKLGRAVEDALIGLLYRDDAQNWRVQATKLWCNKPDRPGCLVEWEITWDD